MSEDKSRGQPLKEEDARYRVLKEFNDGGRLIHDRGKFDDYRVTFQDEEGSNINSPIDPEFFEFLLSYGDPELAWVKVIEIADQIGPKTEFGELQIIPISEKGEERKGLSAFAAAMISEERKAGTRLGKRIKMLGAYQALFCDMTHHEAAN